ncbi:MAG: addiction module protein [Chitinophagaceae bacterium]|nr:addiction module protein [Chitinophagaceae bacterium]
MAYDINELLALPNEEKLAIAQTLWNDVNEEPLELDDDEKKFLDERLKMYRENPDDGISWEEMKQKLKDKYDF